METIAAPEEWCERIHQRRERGLFFPYSKQQDIDSKREDSHTIMDDLKDARKDRFPDDVKKALMNLQRLQQGHALTWRKPL